VAEAVEAIWFADESLTIKRRSAFNEEQISQNFFYPRNPNKESSGWLK
jgi:hypothetical protein